MATTKYPGAFRFGGFRRKKSTPPKKKPVIVLDDLNVPFRPDGPLASFFRAIAEAAALNNVIVYMITHNKYVAYQLWQLTRW
jgi:hypothetical protein